MELSLIHRVAQILRHPCGLGREFGILHRNGTNNYPRDSPVCGARQTIDRIYQIMPNRGFEKRHLRFGADSSLTF
jgi:hypothetical protein